MAIIKNKIVIDQQSREYITKNPVRSSIGAIGYGTVQGINAVVDTIDLSRDIIKLARLSLKESIIEADIEAKKAELNGLDELASLQAELATKKAKLSKA
mgnify:FL=1